MTEQFLFNIFDFIATNEKDVVVDKLKGKPFNKELLTGISPRYLWIKFSDFLGFDKRTRMLFEYFKDSLEKEKYKQSHQLKKEIIRSCGISESLLSKKCDKILERFGESVYEHERHKYLLNDFQEMVSEMKKDENDKFHFISNKISSMELQLQMTVDPNSKEYNLEIAEMVNLNKVTHPFILIDHVKFFFSFFKQNEIN